MKVGKKIILIGSLVVFAIPIITLTRIYSNFPFEFDIFSPPDNTEVAESIVSFGAHQSGADSVLPQKVSNALPPELGDADKIMSDLERDLAKLDQSILTQDIERADALIAEMDKLLSTAGLGYTKLHEKDFVAVTKEIDKLQTQLLEMDIDAEAE